MVATSTTGLPTTGVRLRVVVPVHNAAAFVEQAIGSVLADLPDSSEVVVVDDGSTDGSSGLIDAIAGRDGRLRVIRNDQALGVSRALNAGIRAAGLAEFVAVAEHDDVVLPGRFASQVAALEANPHLGAVSSEGKYLGPSGRIVGRVAVGPTDDAALAEMRSRAAEVLIPHPAITYRRSALDSVGLYDPTFDSAQDLELLNRLVYVGGWGVRVLRTPGVLYRIHDSSMSFSHISGQRMMTRYIRYRNARQMVGEAAMGYDAWAAANVPDARTRRRWARLDRGALMYRRAGLAWITRRPLSFVGNIVGAALLHPRWVLMKLRVASGH